MNLPLTCLNDAEDASLACTVSPDMERAEDLAEYESPPVDEVVLGVYFDRLEQFSANLPVKLLPGMSGYSEFEVQDRLPTELVTDPSTPLEWSMPTLRIGPATPGQRFWLVSSDQQHLVQMQDDLFLVNWRHRGGSYPRFSTLRHRFHQDFEKFCEGIGELGGRPTLSILEVTYVNFITMPLSSFFQPANVLVVNADVVDSEPEGFAWRSVHPIRQESTQLGRLTVECQSAIRPINGGTERGTRLSLSAQVSLRMLNGHDLDDLFQLCSDSIVRTFTSVTTDEAHKSWRRTK